MKRIYLSVLLSVLISNLDAQSFQWAKREGLWAYDYGYGISTDNAGNVIVAGKFEENDADFSGTLIPCAGNHDMFLVSYSPTGSVNWIRTAGGVLGDYAHDMTSDGQNYIYVAGEIEGAGDVISFSGSPITLTALGDNDIMVAKYDMSGNLLWAKSEGGYDGEKALSVTYDASGNVFIGGYYKGAAMFGGSESVTNAGGNDAFLAKYDANGNFQWVRTAKGPGREEILSSVCDASGNVYVCGMYSDGAVFGSTTLTSPLGYLNNFLAKYAPDGTLLWVKSSGSDYDDVAWAVTMDDAGKVYMTGEFNAYATFDSYALTTNGNADVYVACYDAAGTVQWVTQAGGPLIDRARGIGTDGNKIFITGQFGNTMPVGSTNLTAVDSSDIFVAGISNTGAWLWGMSVGGVADSVELLGYESGIDVHADASGYVYATGGMLDGGVFGGTTYDEHGRTDVFVAKIAQMGAGIESKETASALIFPNPANGNFSVRIPADFANNNTVKITNTLGQIVYTATDVDTETSIELSTGSGIYMIEIQSADKRIREKLIIQ